MSDVFHVQPCCARMAFAVRHAIIRQISGPYFGPDVLPFPLNDKIIACPWCGARLEAEERVKTHE